MRTVCVYKMEYRKSFSALYIAERNYHVVSMLNERICCINDLLFHMHSITMRRLSNSHLDYLVCIDWQSFKEIKELLLFSSEQWERASEGVETVVKAMHGDSIPWLL